MITMWELHCGRCGALCYFYDIEPVIGQPVYSEHCINLDGTATHDGDSVECPNCGQVQVESMTWCAMAAAG